MQLFSFKKEMGEVLTGLETTTAGGEEGLEISA